MEPISIAVSIGGALSSSISIGTALKKLKDHYTDAPAFYNFAIQQCSAVSGHLSSLQRLMLEPGWSEQLGTDGETSDHFVTLIINCAEQLRLLLNCVESIDGEAGRGRFMSPKQRLKVVWRDGEVRELVERVKTSKDDIGIVLAVIQAKSSSRIEVQLQRQQLKTSMNTLARSDSTKYRAIAGHDSTVIVVPSNYAGVSGLVTSRVSLSHINLSSIVLTPVADETPQYLNTTGNKSNASRVSRAESVRSAFAGGVYGGEFKAIANKIEQDRAGMLQKLKISDEALEKAKMQNLQLEEDHLHERSDMLQKLKLSDAELERCKKQNLQMEEELKQMTQELVSEHASSLDYIEVLENSLVEMQKKSEVLKSELDIALEKNKKDIERTRRQQQIETSTICLNLEGAKERLRETSEELAKSLNELSSKKELNTKLSSSLKWNIAKVEEMRSAHELEVASLRQAHILHIASEEQLRSQEKEKHRQEVEQLRQEYHELREVAKELQGYRDLTGQDMSRLRAREREAEVKHRKDIQDLQQKWEDDVRERSQECQSHKQKFAEETKRHEAVARQVQERHHKEIEKLRQEHNDKLRKLPHGVRGEKEHLAGWEIPIWDKNVESSRGDNLDEREFTEWPQSSQRKMNEIKPAPKNYAPIPNQLTAADTVSWPKILFLSGCASIVPMLLACLMVLFSSLFG